MRRPATITTSAAVGEGRSAADVSPPEVKAECDRIEAEKDEAIRRIEDELAPLERDFARSLAGRPAISGSDSITKWRYTTSEPPGDWMEPGFDDHAWQEGHGGFGAPGTPGALIGTEWREPKIWLRRTFEWEGDPSRFSLIVHHDDEIAIWVNGKLVAQAGGYVVEYGELPVRGEIREALRQGENQIAVFCRQDFGGQYVDVIPVPDRDAALAALDRYRSKHRELDAVPSDPGQTDHGRRAVHHPDDHPDERRERRGEHAEHDRDAPVDRPPDPQPAGHVSAPANTSQTVSTSASVSAGCSGSEIRRWAISSATEVPVGPISA